METSGDISSWNWNDTNGGSQTKRLQVACDTSQMTTWKQSSFLPTCTANLVPCYSCSSLLLSSYVLSAVITVTGWLWSVLWRIPSAGTAQVRVESNQPVPFPGLSIMQGGTTLELKQNKTTSGNFSSCVWLASFTPKGSIVKPAIPQSPAVLEMLNFKGENSPGLRRKNALDVEWL